MDEFINTVSTKLPTWRWKEIEYTILGATALLSALQLDKSKVDPRGIYSYRGDGIEMLGNASEHRLNMRTAYYKKGKAGVLSYLKQFLEPDQFDDFRRELLNVKTDL